MEDDRWRRLQRFLDLQMERYRCMSYTKGKKSSLKKSENCSTGKNWNDVSVRQNYKSYVFSKKEWFFCMLQSLGITGIINFFCYRAWWAWGLGIPIGIWYVRWKKQELAERRRRILQNHFKEVLQGLQTAVRAGYSMEQSVTECRKEMERLFGSKDDLVRELHYMESQMQVGVPVEQLFWNLGQRSGVEEIRNFGDIFLIARRSGGNLGKILGNLAEVLGEKIRVNGEIQVAIAGKKLEQLVMSLVPGGMILYMQMTSSGFLNVLYHNLPGTLVMTGCLGVYVFSFRMGRKIVRIQV